MHHNIYIIKPANDDLSWTERTKDSTTSNNWTEGGALLGEQILYSTLQILGNTNYKLRLLVKTNYKLRPPTLFARNKLVFSSQWVPSIFGLREEFTFNFENLFQHLLEGEQTGCKGIGVLRLLHDCLMSNISFFYVLWSARCHFKDCSLQKRKIKEMIDLIFLALALCLNQPKTK